jgi:hypothetical protein
MGEEWRVVAEFPNYEVSNQARVRNTTTGFMLKTQYDKDGYAFACISHAGRAKNLWIHRLVAQTFIGEIPPDMEVDHIDRNRTNNAISNLRIITKTQNIRNSSRRNGHEHEFVAELSQDAIMVEEYGEHRFNDIYYDQGEFYRFNIDEYMRLTQIRARTCPSYYVNARNTNGKNVQIYVDKYRRMINVA